MTETITFPETNPETQTLNALLALTLQLEVPLHLKAIVEDTDVPHSLMSGHPYFKLKLLVSPPEGTDNLMPVTMYLARAIHAPKTPNEPFWFEDELGKLNIPWGQKLTPEQAKKVFKPWVGKEVLAVLDTVEYKGITRLHIAKILQKGDQQ